MAIKDTVKKVINKITDTTSDVLSVPARAKADAANKKADADVADIKLVRKTKGVDTSGSDYKDPIFRARANVSNMKFDREYAQTYAKKMSGKKSLF